VAGGIDVHGTPPPAPPSAPPSGTQPERGAIVGLKVPADMDRPVALVAVTLTAAARSEVVGSLALDGAWDGRIGGTAFTFYLGEDRVLRDRPSNERAVVLSARLGNVDREWLAGLRGDALVVGQNAQFDDADVPVAVVVAAWQTGLLGPPWAPVAR
jgi:hypothetical protein